MNTFFDDITRELEKSKAKTHLLKEAIGDFLFTGRKHYTKPRRKMREYSQRELQNA